MYRRDHRGNQSQVRLGAGVLQQHTHVAQVGKVEVWLGPVRIWLELVRIRVRCREMWEAVKGFCHPVFRCLVGICAVVPQVIDAEDDEGTRAMQRLMEQLSLLGRCLSVGYCDDVSRV